MGNFRFELEKAKKIRKPHAKKIDSFVDQKTTIEEHRITLVLPIKLVSEGNCFEHWTKKHSRHKSQHASIYLAMLPFKSLISLPCSVHLTRYSPKFLDEHDNLRMSWKYAVDKVSECLTGVGKGKGDNDPRITWVYHQEKSSSYGVKLVFEF